MVRSRAHRRMHRHHTVEAIAEIREKISDSVASYPPPKQRRSNAIEKMVSLCPRRSKGHEDPPVEILPERDAAHSTDHKRMGSLSLRWHGRNRR